MVIGPPLAYALAMGFSFTVMYLSAAVAFIVCGVMVWLFLPSMQKELPLATGTVEAPRRNRRDTLLLFVICTLMCTEQPVHHQHAAIYYQRTASSRETGRCDDGDRRRAGNPDHVDCRIFCQTSG